MPNFVRDVVERRPAGDLAAVTISRAGERRSWTFGELVRLSGGG
jgi:hypothetical protein